MQQPEIYNAEKSRQRNELGKWLHQARTTAGMNQKEVAASLEQNGIRISGGGISKWETGEHIPTPYQLYALCQVLGEDCPLLGTPMLNGLNDTGRKKVSAYIADLRATGLYRQENEPEKKPLQRMKVYALPVSAGTGLALEGEDYDWQSFPAESVPRGAEFGIRVRGDSMTPRFRDGQIVWIHRQRELREGDIGVFVLDGEAFLKQLRYDAPTPEEQESYGSGSIAVLKSLNPRYAPKRVMPAQRLDLVGRVLETEEK